MPGRIAYLTDGRLFLAGPEGEPRHVESKFADSVRARAASIHRRTAWKVQGTGARFMRGGRGDQEEVAAASVHAAITALTRGRTPGELLYTLDTDAVTGLFAVDTATLEETRLFHGNQDRLAHPTARPGQERLACARWGEDGASHLVVMRADGSHPVMVTEGETVDQAPSWIPGRPGELVYQSAGIGRSRDGQLMGLGPATICRLDVERGALTTLLEDPRSDFLCPRLAVDGALYCIRRPYRPVASVSPLRLVVDLLAFPYRLLVALFQWLNFFGVRYTGRPLITPQGAKAKEADARQWMLWGNIIDAAREQRRGASEGEDVAGLVPRTWVLERHAPDGASSVVARGVACFDLDEDGVVYSNGSAVYRLGRDGTRQRLAKAPRIECVVAID